MEGGMGGGRGRWRDGRRKGALEGGRRKGAMEGWREGPKALITYDMLELLNPLTRARRTSSMGPKSLTSHM